MAGTTLSTFTGGWLTTAEENAVVGSPATPIYPGPLTSNHADPGPADPGRSGPPVGGQAPGFPDQAYQDDLRGGIISDTVAELGHSAPEAPTFSQVKPFAPPGPIADTHGLDTGGTYRTQHVTQPRSPGWFRRVLTGQTNNRQAQVTDNAGWAQLAPNGRVDLDQYQGQAADGYDPAVIPYAERPVLANYAAEAFPVTLPPGGYIPDGALPDMAAQGGQGNFGYAAPPDPVVNVQAPQPQQAIPAVASMSGMEYISG